MLLLMNHALGQTLRYVLVIAAALYLMNQFRKPTKWFGRLIAWTMNFSHSSLTDWGLQHVKIAEKSAMLDVGCGGGRTVAKLAALAPGSTVYGIDYADGSVAASRRKNAQLIRAGRVQITKSSVSQIPFSENKFDLVTAVETQYYWPDPVNDMREVFRVIKPGGTLIVIAESYKKGRFELLQRPVMRFLRSTSLDVNEQRELFSAAGFSDVQIIEERKNGWLCGMGTKR